MLLASTFYIAKSLSKDSRRRRTSTMRGQQAVLLLQLTLFCVASGIVRTQGTVILNSLVGSHD